MSSSSDPIKYSDLVEEGAFEKYISNVEELNKAIGLLKGTFVDYIKASKGAYQSQAPTTISEAEAFKEKHKAVTDADNAVKKLNRTQKELTVEVAKARQAQADLNQDIKTQAKLIESAEGSYNQLSASLSRVSAQWKALSENERENTETGKQLTKVKTELQEKLKALDAATGVHVRNVGNYEGAVRVLGKGVKGLTGILGELGTVMGLDTTAMEGLINLGAEFGKTAKELHHSMELEKIGHVENTAAIETETVAQETANAVSLSTIGIVAGVVAGITAAAYAIYEYTKEVEDSSEAVSIYNKYLAEQQKQINELNKSAMDKKLEYDVATGAKTKEQAELYKITYDWALRKLKVEDETQKATLELHKQYDAKIKKEKIKNGSSFTESQFLEPKLKGIKEKETKALLAADQDYWTAKALLTQKSINELSDSEAKQTKEKKEEVNKGLALDLEQLYKEEEDAYRLNKKRVEDGRLAEDEYYQKKKKDYLDAMTAENMEIIKRYGDEAIEEARKMRLKEQQETINQAQAMLKIEEEYLNKKSQLKIDAIDHDLQRNKSALEVEATLAAAGRDNTLAYELKRQDELEKQRQTEIENQKKKAKEMEEIQLALAFVAAYTKDLETMKPMQALASAATETIAAKLLSKSIAGSAFEGTEDTGNAGNVDEKGGKLWVLHPHERVVTAEQNAKLAGISNEDLVNRALMFENFTPVLNDVSKKKQVDTAMLSIVAQKLDDVKRAIEEKQETNIDNLGNVVKTQVKRGVRRTIIKQTFLD